MRITKLDMDNVKSKVKSNWWLNFNIGMLLSVPVGCYIAYR
jgi:hypothetical protein